MDFRRLAWQILPGAPAAVVLAAIVAASLVNSMDWSFGDMRAMVALCLGSVVAATALAAGWASQPEEIERWSLRAALAALASALPALITA